MSNKSSHFPRREFLAQCAALPLAAGLVSFHSARASGDQSDDLRALLKLVPPAARYHREPVPEADNAWPILLKAKDVIQIPDELSEVDGDITLWDEAMTLRSFPRSKGGGQLHDVLLKHNDALRLIDQAAAKTRLQYPEPRGWKTFDRDTDNIGHIRDCLLLKTLRAKLAFHEQRYADAARDLCQLLQLGRLLMLGDGFAVQWLVAGVVRSETLQNLRRLSAAREVPTDVLKHVLSVLDKTALEDDGAAQALRVELCCFALPILIQIPETKDVTELVRGLMTEYVCHNPPPKQTQAAKNCQRFEQGVAALLAEHPSAFDHRATVELGGKITADAIKQLKRPFLTRKRESHEAVEKELADWPKPLWLDDSFPFLFIDLGETTGKLELPSQTAIASARDKLHRVNNPLGKMLILSNADTAAGLASCLAAARLHATRLIVVLNLFQRANQRLPDRLDSLIDSKLLSQIPIDPFDGKPFKYSPDRRVLWCVGQEGKNEGLLPEKDDAENPFDEDLESTWRIEAI